jgi:lipopolysaccharide export system permease protein
MGTLDRYVLRQVLIATVLVAATLTCAIWLTQSLRFVELIVNRGLTIGTFFYLTLLLLPSFLWLLLPISLFAAVLFTYLRLTTDSELVVMRSFGRSPMQLALPGIALAGAVSATCYALAFYFLPLAYRDFKDLEFTVRNDFAGLMLREGSFNPIAPGMTVYVRMREASGDLIGILLHDNRKADAPVTMVAERGRLAVADGGPRVVLVSGNRQELDRATGRVRILYFDRYSVDIGRIGERTADRWREPRERFMHELFGSARDDADRGRLRAEGHNRLVAPLLPVSMTLVAIAALLAGDHNRRGQNRRVVAAVVLAAALQASNLSMQNVVTKWPAAVPLLYANALLPMLLAGWWLARGTPAWIARLPALLAAPRRGVA